MTIRLAGPFTVENGDGPVLVGGGKSRRLLARLAAAQGRPVAVGAIVADLWPAVRPRRPVDNVATLVSRLRAVLGPDVVLGSQAGDSAKAAAEADPGLGAAAREAVLAAHLTICILKTTV